MVDVMDEFQTVLIDPDGRPVTVGGLSREDLAANIAAKQAEWAARRGRIDFIARVRELTGLARSANWDWIDAYCHPTVAQIPFVSGQSPDAGALWAALSTFDKAERLRLGDSLAMVEIVRLSQAIDLVLEVLQKIIERNPDLVPPPDR